jgi:hypothetical protein
MEYWITLTSVTPSAVSWHANFSSAGFGVANTQFFYGNGVNPASGITYGSSTGGTYNMEMQVAVPEPSTYCMALTGLACGGYSMFRRRKKQA